MCQKPDREGGQRLPISLYDLTCPPYGRASDMRMQCESEGVNLFAQNLIQQNWNSFGPRANEN